MISAERLKARVDIVAANGTADVMALGMHAIGHRDSGGLPNDDDASSLPSGHPAWQRNALTVSSRVWAILATLRPFAVRVLTFWDHAVRAIRMTNRTLEVDPSGCYRLR